MVVLRRERTVFCNHFTVSVHAPQSWDGGEKRRGCRWSLHAVCDGMVRAFVYIYEYL